MEPGTGKTRTAYELVKSVSDVDYILWLTPFQTKQNLREEIEKCGSFTAELEIVGIESLSNSSRIYLKLMQTLENKICPFIICDESLKIKNIAAKRTRRILEIGSKAEYKLILNGTPLSRNMEDLWAQFEFLSPKILSMDLRRFTNTFCEWVEKKYRQGGRVFKKSYITGHHNVKYLYSLIKHYVYEADLELDLSDMHISRYYDIDNEHAEEYYRLKNEFLDNTDINWKPNFFLEMITKMQHVYTDSNQKFQILERILSEYSNDEKVIVFCKFVRSAEAITLAFPQVTVLTYGKHAYGLNMQDHMAMVFWDKTFDYAQYVQAFHRIYRTGQKSDVVYYYHLHGNIGLDKMIERNIGKKQGLLNAFKSCSVEEMKKQLAEEL